MTSPAVGSFYEFKNPETQLTTIGKVVSIESDIVIYLAYQRSFEYFGEARKPYHTPFELIRTDEQSKEFIQNVQREIKVLREGEFRKRVQEDPFVLDNSDKNTIFFFRQRLVGKTLDPELSPMCICGVIWSPLDA